MPSSTTVISEKTPNISRKREWRKAWRALQQLIATPEDTNQVFIIMRALTGKSFESQFKRFSASPVGKEVLAEKRDLLDTLVNRDYIRSLPEGSFGKTYYDFCQREGISPEGLVDASNDHYDDFTSEDTLRFAMRGREAHDLWHILSGYGRDGFGEACVVAFSYAQTKNLGFAAIAVMGAYHFKKEFPKAAVWTAVWQAYRLGRKTAWLSGVDIEEMLPRQLTELREELNIFTPDIYAAQKDVIQGTHPDTYALAAAE